MKKLPLLILLALGGCGTVDTVKGWMGKTHGVDEPAALVAFNESAKFTERWHASVGDPGQNPLHAALTADAVYGVSGKGTLTRLQRDTGRQVWSIESKIQVSAGVGAGEGLVLIGSDKGELHAFGEDGKLRWKQTVSSEVLGVPQASEGVVIVRSGDGHIAGLSVADGHRLWVYERSTPALVVRSHASVTLRRGIAYAGFAGGKLVAIKISDGSLLWENSVSQPRGNTELERISDITSNPVVSDAQVCAIAFQGRLACYEAVQGNPLWNREISSDKGLSILRKQLYLSDSTGGVMALDKDSGSTVWKNDQLQLRDTSTPCAQDQYVIVGDYQGVLHALSREDGRFAARIKLDGSPIQTPPVEMDSGFLVQTRSGGIYSLSIH
ncbi:outer membrane protein assembly factor BamB [Gallionella capsiferriformans]|uniref:Outer membrane protein assembly factor BamB n=1 Tax=Gallionella capsiferriformans (strain ES-2) TaxID=395494 RepID=D9SFX0_GALCS|nr:outer membrane protein assembly factor BamB [Gallionella capsiferriformans]ADL55417.1 outer membrane assembly lipoprotein YfgL [Gallionella capsiferriformans ES-2]